MSKKLLIKNILLGFMSWLIPFGISFLFYKPNGELVVPYATFKTAIMVIGTCSGCYLLYQFFKYVEVNYLKNGVIVGFSWFVINIILDVIVLIPIMKVSFVSYFWSIGLGYFAIPILGISMGFLLEKKLSNYENK
jgi:hypothetical protein